MEHKSYETLDHPDNSVTDTKIGNRTMGSLTGLLQQLLLAIELMFKAVTGEENWNAVPKLNLTNAAVHRENQNIHISEEDRLNWNNKLSVDGGTIKGTLTLQTPPTAPNHAATKEYVDESIIATGSGDMTKSVYDSNNDGIVNAAAVADTLKTPRKINGVLFDGSKDITIDAVQTASNIDGGSF